MSIEENLKENKSTKENCTSQRWSQLATFLLLFLLIPFVVNLLKCICSSDTGGARRHCGTLTNLLHFPVPLLTQLHGELFF